jgi:hypothetical protein
MKTALGISLASVLMISAGLLLTACQKKTEPASPPADVSQDVKVGNQQPSEAAIVQKTCPVMEGNPINEDIFVEYKGKKVYFCCPACIELFNKDPEKYVKNLPQFKE